MAIDGKIKPNEDFWQNLSCESVYSSPEKISKATDTLKAVITWAFGIFSMGGFALTVFGNSFKDYNSFALLFLGIAFFYAHDRLCTECTGTISGCGNIQ